MTLPNASGGAGTVALFLQEVRTIKKQQNKPTAISV